MGTIWSDNQSDWDWKTIVWYKERTNLGGDYRILGWKVRRICQNGGKRLNSLFFETTFQSVWLLT